jgi:hypothetical protein
MRSRERFQRLRECFRVSDSRLDHGEGFLAPLVADRLPP